MKRYALIILLFIANGAGYAQVVFKPLTFGAACALAKAEHKYIIADVYTDWCRWCAEIDKNTYAAKAVGDYVEANFIPVKINAEKTEGVAFANAHGVQGYPTIIFFDETGAEVYRVTGYQAADAFLASLQTARTGGNKGKNSPETGDTANTTRQFQLIDSHKPPEANIHNTDTTLCARVQYYLPSYLVSYDSIIARTTDNTLRAMYMDDKATIYFREGNFMLAVSEEKLALATIDKDEKNNQIISLLKKLKNNLNKYENFARNN